MVEIGVRADRPVRGDTSPGHRVTDEWAGSDIGQNLLVFRCAKTEVAVACLSTSYVADSVAPVR